ncbi:MAG: AAA family ATPase [Oscillospiraceae bacterium]|nr:AAA family ATPase [Oscillospiraceae bacterium]
METSSNENQIKITGVVDNVIYRNEDNGYIVFEIDYEDAPLTIIGTLGEILPGEKLTLTGEYIVTPKYGKQFKATVCERSRPKTTDEIASYLSSGIFQGVGAKTALNIVREFGEETLDIIEHSPERLREVKGITIAKAATIGSTFRKICGVNTVLEFLSKFGISPATSVMVWNKYDCSAVALIKQNPFLLCDEGIEIDFQTADRIAEEFGGEPFSVQRIKAGISHVLHENSRIGHTCVPLKRLGERVINFLQISSDAFDIALGEGIDEKKFMLYTPKSDDNIKPQQNSCQEFCGLITATCGNSCEYVYLAVYYRAEIYITEKLSQMLKMNSAHNRDFSEQIAQIEHEEAINYERLQKAAIQACLENNLFILTGGPGTGKTTTLNAVIRLLKESRRTLSLAAPTGRAAKRMSELTGEPAQTIHRLLEVDGSYQNTGLGMTVFKKNDMNPLNADVIIVDEMSMVDVLLFEALLRACKPDTKLIMAGDSEQLPAVGAGNVLSDLISSDKIKEIRLIEIFRQAQESLIVTNAHKIISGEMPELSCKNKDFFFMPCGGGTNFVPPTSVAEYNESDDYENYVDYAGASEYGNYSHDSYNDSHIIGEEIAQTVVSLVQTRLPNAYGFDPFDDIQVLSPTKMGAAGTRELNRLLQNAINPKSMRKQEMRFGDVVFRMGDKVMATSNDYNIEWKRDGERGMGVFNGESGIITDFDGSSGGVYINFDGRVAFIPQKQLIKIEHAYAITVHKSQGSEYKAVIMPIPNTARRLLYRSLLYTGVTRARDLLILIGKNQTIAEMVSNECETTRISCLKDMLVYSP